MQKEISWADFEKVEIRTGTIVSAEMLEGAKKPAYKLAIDFGEYGVKKSSAQITKLYSVEQLTGMQVVAVVNFPPRQIGKFMSECLVLGAVDDDTVSLLTPSVTLKNGLRIA
ncbi:MAG TPA: tRNA-binding protein [Flavipsychrobacter sp.]|nr:tRNA-binding protein [Flavipsychrobacter sp.]